MIDSPERKFKDIDEYIEFIVQSIEKPESQIVVSALWLIVKSLYPDSKIRTHIFCQATDLLIGKINDGDKKAEDLDTDGNKPVEPG